MRKAAAGGFINATDCADFLVGKGLPFRDAYKSVGIEVNEGRFHAEKTVNHSHEGSIGNLCTERIKAKMDKAASFAKE